LSTSTRSDVTVAHRPAGRPARPVARWIGAFTAAWGVPFLTHLVGLDWLLPLVVLVGLMALQRAGRTWLDRLVLAVAQLFGTLCVAGFVLTVWPWHLHPVAVAGSALSGLLVVAAVTGRRLELPARLTPGDVVVSLCTLAVGLLTVVPFAVRSAGERIGLVATGEDMARHFLLFDLVGKVGGYPFLHGAPPAGYGTGMQNYPQGAHLLYAVLDRFARSSNVNADGVTAMNALLWCHLGTYLFFVVAVLWSSRRVSGPGSTAATVLPILATVVGVLYFGDLLTLFLRGYPNEMLALSLVAILTAILARPFSHTGEQIVTVAALLLGISFSYHLFLPYAAAVAAAWAWFGRGRLRHRRGVLIAAAAFLPLLVVTPLANKPSGTPTLLLAPGTAFASDRVVIGLVLACAVLGLVARGGRRAPDRRLLLLAIGAAGALVALLLAYQYVAVGHSVYYFEKLVHMLLVVALVALGAAGRLLPHVQLGTTGAFRRVVPGLVGAALVTLFLASFGGRWHLQPFGSHGVRYVLGMERGSPWGGQMAVAFTRLHPDGAGKVDVVLTRTPYSNFYATLFTAAMQRNYQHGERWYVFLSPAGKARTLADLDAMVRDSPVPLRFYVQNPRASYLVTDPAHPRRPEPGTGVDPAAFGDPDALTNMEAAQYLAGRYPDRVEIIRLEP
jgi:hypothetical protein